MRWSLNEIVVESSRVECELCSGDCRGDGTECKQQGKSSELCCGMTRNCGAIDSARQHHGTTVFQHGSTNPCPIAVHRLSLSSFLPLRAYFESAYLEELFSFS